MTTTIRSNKMVAILWTLTALLIVSGCFESSNEARNDPRPIFAVSVEPHAFLLDRIGGDRIRVEVLVPSGQDPHHYEATPEKIAALSKARVLFRTGMPFEDVFLPKLQSVSKNLEIVDLRVGLVLRTLELHSHDNGDASTGHEHHVGCSHDGLDPHIWFAPTMLKRQAETVLRTLLEKDVDRENQAFFRKNFEAFVEEIEATRKELAEKLAPFKGRTVFVFHPSYGYFCDEFGLKQTAVEFEGKSPGPQRITELIAATKNEGGAPVIFVQPEFNRAPAEAIAEATGGKIVVHSGLDRDVLANLRRFTDEFVRAETGK